MMTECAWINFRLGSSLAFYHYLYPDRLETSVKGSGFNLGLSVRLSICFSHPISKTDAVKCSTVSPGNLSVLGSKGQQSRSRVTKTLPT